MPAWTIARTREIIGPVQSFEDEADYVAGLVHDVGKIVMASAFPQHFAEIHQCCREVVQDLKEVEIFVLGMDHTEVGGIYLRSHRVPEIFVETARYHHCPEQAGANRVLTAAVQIANLSVRHAKIGVSGDVREVTWEECLGASGWRFLFPEADEGTLQTAHLNLKHSLERLPRNLTGMV